MIFKNKIEELDTKEIVFSKYINWEYFKNSTILITGATGLIGFQTVLAILYANETLNTNIKVLALVRNRKKASKMFNRFQTNKLKSVVQDILKPLSYKGKIDFILHTANTTSSKEMAEKPAETIDSIVVGTKNILEFAKNNKVKSIVYLSSMEVYGDIPLSQKGALKEEDLGELDIMKPRSSYPMGKRLAESMCSAYAKEYGVPVKIARLAQTIGAGVDYNDNRVFAQFARNIVEKKDIVLKTKGETTRSYIYITDMIAAVMVMFEKGADGESYNIANPNTTCSIKDMAQMLVDKHESSKLRFEIDDKPNFYLKTLKYELDTTKFENLSGWKAVVSIEKMFSRLISSFEYSDFFDVKSDKNKLLQSIFSINNESFYKIITILGKQIKLDRRKIYSKKYGDKSVIKNKILFNNFGGNGYGCNLKYIAEEIIRRNLPVELVWMCKDEEKMRMQGLPSKIKTTKFNNKKGLNDLFTSKIIISNVHLNRMIARGWMKLKNQTYIQTWHGSLGIKKVDYSVKNNNSAFFTKEWDELTRTDIAYTDYLISNSIFEENVFKEGLLWNKEFFKTGHPRNDVFFYPKDRQEQIKNKIFSFYNIDSNKRVALYAPSFRDDMKLDSYNIDYQKLYEALKNKYNCDWIILSRMHPNITNYGYKTNIKQNYIIDVGLYPDIQELLVTADVGISDYSSWMFDYMLSKKPVFIYATDIEEYNTERGFYYPLQETPFAIATNNEELAKNIEKFDNKRYIKNVDKFLKDKGCMEDGHASERVADLIEGIISGKR